MIIKQIIFWFLLSYNVSNQQLIRPVNVYTSIIEAIHLIFNNTCIIFMHTVDEPIKSQELRESEEFKILQAHFSGLFIRTALMNLKTFEKKVGPAYFHIKRPLFVLLNDNEVMKYQFSRGIATWITMAYPTWVIFFENTTSVDEFFAEIFIPFDCIFLVVKKSEDLLSEIIYEIYQINTNNGKITAQFGSWNYEMGLEFNKLSLYQRRSDLFGHEIRVIAIQDPPLSIIERNKNGEMIDLKGFFGTILRIIQKSMNCSYSFQEASVWGTISSNGTTTGIIESLLNNKADLAASALTMTTNRLGQIAFTTPLYTARCRTYIRKPSYASVKWEAYFAPFDFGIWESLAVLIAISSFAILAARSLATILDDELKHSDQSTLTLSETMLLVYGAFCSQGIEHTSIDSVRIIHVMIHMTGVIILSAYSAALISFLAVKVFVMPFTTMEGLLKEGTYRFSVVGESSDYELFQNTTDETLKNMFEKALDMQEPLPNNYYDGLKQVCGKNKYAFMTLDNIVAVLKSKINCTLEPLDVIMQTTNGMAVRLRSPYQGIINSNMLMMKDSGVMQRLFANEWSKELDSGKSAWTPVDINDILPLVSLLAAGIIFGGVLLCSEYIFQKTIRKCKGKISGNNAVKKLINVKKNGLTVD